MNRRASLILVLFLSVAVAVSAWAAQSGKPPTSAKTPGVELATVLSEVTGIAISPLLGVGAVGAYKYFNAVSPEEQAKLPWYAQMSFWLPALILVGLCAAKDTIAPLLPPGMKKPFDIAEVLENKLSGLVAAGAVIPSLVAASSKLIVESSSLGHALPVASGLAMVPFASIDMSWLLTILMVPLAIAVFAVVWVVGHAINVLILLSPWGGVDTALKGMRTAVLGLVVTTAYINPVVGAIFSLIVVVLAYFMAGWAFRLMVFGSEFSWDFFTFRRHRFQPLADGNKLFTAREISGVPMRTYGRLRQDPEGRLLFKFRPWLILSERTVEVSRDGLVVGKGVFFSEILGFDRVADKNRTLLLLPPRYRGHEELMARTYRISGTCEVGLRKAWSWIKEAFGFGAKKLPHTT